MQKSVNKSRQMTTMYSKKILPVNTEQYLHCVLCPWCCVVKVVFTQIPDTTRGAPPPHTMSQFIILHNVLSPVSEVCLWWLYCSQQQQHSDVMAIVKVSIDINDRHIDVGGGTIKVAIAVLLFVYCGSWKSCGCLVFRFRS